MAAVGIPLSSLTTPSVASSAPASTSHQKHHGSTHLSSTNTNNYNNHHNNTNNNSSSCLASRQRKNKKRLPSGGSRPLPPELKLHQLPTPQQSQTLSNSNSTLSISSQPHQDQQDDFLAPSQERLHPHAQETFATSPHGYYRSGRYPSLSQSGTLSPSPSPPPSSTLAPSSSSAAAAAAAAASQVQAPAATYISLQQPPQHPHSLVTTLPPQQHLPQYPSYRPYTPTTPTPTTPNGLQPITITPVTPTFSSTATFGAGYASSPRLDQPSLPQQQQHSSTGSTYSQSLYPYSKGQRSGSVAGATGAMGSGVAPIAVPVTGTRSRMVGNETYDPYRSRQPALSATRVKTEYQAHSPMRESHTTFPQQTPPPLYTGYGSSVEDAQENGDPYLAEGSTAGDDLAPSMMHPPLAAGQRDDHLLQHYSHHHQYRPSPTLTASQTLAATYARAESPYNHQSTFHSYQPYSRLPSPSIFEGYRTSASYSSPSLGPHGYEESRSEHRSDPYRASHLHHLHNMPHQQACYLSTGSPYIGSIQGSPRLDGEFSSSFDSRYSSSNNTTKYPSHVLAGQDSSQMLSASYHDGHQPSQQQSQQRTAMTMTSSSSELGMSEDHENDRPTKANNAGPSVSSATAATVATVDSRRVRQPSKKETAASRRARAIEEEENEVILQKLGVFTAPSTSTGTRSGGTRSGFTNSSSGRSRRKGQWTDESEEDALERGRGSGRFGKSKSRIARTMSSGRHGSRGHRASNRRDRCCYGCCSRRSCLCISLLIFLLLALLLFFVVPREPKFAFEAVVPMGAPVITANRIRESFSIQVMIDSTQSYIPIRIDKVDMGIWLRPDNVKIADNNNTSSGFVIRPRITQLVSIPMLLDYKAHERDFSTDKTMGQLVRACMPKGSDSALAYPGAENAGVGSKNELDILVQGTVHIWGLSWIWKPQFALQVNDVPCPANAKSIPGSEQPPSETQPVVQPMPSMTAIMAGSNGILPQSTPHPAPPPVHPLPPAMTSPQEDAVAEDAAGFVNAQGERVTRTRAAPGFTVTSSTTTTPTPTTKA